MIALQLIIFNFLEVVGCRIKKKGGGVHIAIWGVSLFCPQTSKPTFVILHNQQFHLLTS